VPHITPEDRRAARQDGERLARRAAEQAIEALSGWLAIPPPAGRVHIVIGPAKRGNGLLSAAGLTVRGVFTDQGDAARYAGGGQGAEIHTAPLDSPGEVQAGAPGPELAGRQLFLIRCLLLAVTEDGGLTTGGLTESALKYARTAEPPVTGAEIDALLYTVFCGDPRDGEPRYTGSAPRYMPAGGAQMDAAAPGPGNTGAPPEAGQGTAGGPAGAS
jgi:hypothetical protein